MKLRGTLWWSFLLFALTFALTLESIEARCSCNEGWKSYLCSRCYGPCPTTLHPVTEFERLTRTELFGQSEAVSMLADVLRGRNGDRPTAVHLVGPNGVGKSHTAKLMGRAFFETLDKQTRLGSGVLWISGKDYRFKVTEHEIKEAREDIRRLIVHHLWKCPQAIVVFDEAEVMRYEILGILEDFIGDSHPFVESRDHKLKVSTKDAIFVLVSDFGKEKVNLGVSRAELVDFVNAETSVILRNPRLVQLLQSVVPFLPLPKVNCTERTGELDQAVLDYVNFLISQLRNHSIVKEKDLTITAITGEFKAVAKEVLQRVATSDLCWRNYRGVYQVFDELVTGPFARKLSAYRQQKVRINLHSPLSNGIEVHAEPRKKLEL